MTLTWHPPLTPFLAHTQALHHFSTEVTLYSHTGDMDVHELSSIHPWIRKEP